MRRAAKRRRDRRLFSAATLPYRKDDVTAIDDSLRHPYFASHGYASVRVDIRGSGNSDGVLTDEYSLQEQDDALEVIDWIAAQPWCTGSLGMMGISWGGFNSLQVAARRPPQLKAIISACSTDDRYADDVHYMGGCLLGYYMLPWASVMLAFNARPPDHLAVGERWRALWLERLEANRLLVDPWVVHQRRDAYWRHGSVCEDYAAIECAVYLVGGWADAYTNAIFRMLEGLECPRKALVGPWSHLWPEQGRARPRDRVPPGSGPLVGPLAEGRRQRDHARADAPGVDAGGRRATKLLRRTTRSLGRREHLAGARNGAATVRPRSGPAPGEPGAGCPHRPSERAHRRTRRRSLVLVRQSGRPPARPASRRCALAQLHVRARWASRSSCSDSRSSTCTSRSTSRLRSSSPASATSAPTARRRSSRERSSISAMSPGTTARSSSCPAAPSISR